MKGSSRQTKIRIKGERPPQRPPSRRAPPSFLPWQGVSGRATAIFPVFGGIGRGRKRFSLPSRCPCKPRRSFSLSASSREGRENGFPCLPTLEKGGNEAFPPFRVSRTEGKSFSLSPRSFDERENRSPSLELLRERGKGALPALLSLRIRGKSLSFASPSRCKDATGHRILPVGRTIGERTA